MGLKKYFIKRKQRETIEAEEIFLDAQAIRSIENQGKLEKPIKKRNFLLFYGLIVLILGAFFLRAGYLQIAKGGYYRELAEGNCLRIYQTPAPRGLVYDRMGAPLVYNIPQFNLIINPIDFYENSLLEQEKIILQLSQIIGFQPDQLKNKLAEFKSDSAPGMLLKDIQRDEALVLETRAKDWPGLRLEKNAQRQYYLGTYFAHVLGYTGQVSQEDLATDSSYLITDQIGKSGLEKFYESVLRGQTGQKQYQVDSLGRIQGLVAKKEPEPGHGLILHLDKKLQEKLYHSLSQQLDKLANTKDQSQRAAAVAIDPRNGGIRALVSLPSYDNNLFSQGISQEDLNKLYNDSNNPFLNRVLAGQYPSGSVVKPLVAAGALQEEIVDLNDQINCHGSISVVNEYFPDTVYHFKDWKAHGITNIVKAIAESCNVFFYALGGGLDEIKGLGVEKLVKYLTQFGLGQKTNIDLFGEKKGLVPDREWKKQAKPDEEWYLGDTYHLSIGQGDILVTPLQMAVAISAIANGGYLYQPQLVDKIVDLKGDLLDDIPISEKQSNFIDKSKLAIVQKGMRQAVVSGSAMPLRNLPVQAAAKTGTAQYGNQDKTHAWFVAYAPYQDPELVLIVLIEGGGEGSQTALPVANQVLDWYFNSKN